MKAWQARLLYFVVLNAAVQYVTSLEEELSDSIFGELTVWASSAFALAQWKSTFVQKLEDLCRYSRGKKSRMKENVRLIYCAVRAHEAGLDSDNNMKGLC